MRALRKVEGILR